MLPLMESITAAASNKPAPSIGRYLSPALHDPTAASLAAFLGTAVFVLFVVKGILAVGVLRWNLGTVLNSEARMAERLLSAYLTAPWLFHLERNSAELQRTVQDSVRRVFEDGLVGVLGAFADLVILLAVTIVLIILEPTVAVFAILFFSSVGLGYQQLIHGRIRSAALATHDETMQAYVLVQQSLSASKEIALGGKADYFSTRLRDAKLRLSRGQRTLLLSNQLPRYYLEIALLCGVGLLSVILYATSSPSGAAGALALFLAAGFRLLPSLNRIIVATNLARAGKPALSQIINDLVQTRGPEETGGDLTAFSFQELELAHVTFRYPQRSVPALVDVSARILRGESVALVGSSGAGKSTLADVILGLLIPEAGEVRIDGKPLQLIRTSWQRSVGYVPQQVALLDDTLKANIAFGLAPEKVDMYAVTNAVQMSELEDLVESLQAGLDTVIGEGGARLSGGQRQRVGIARALYNSPTTLVLDEATSALDSATESRIAHTLNALKGGLTMITIAHRLSTVRDCDRIYLLRQGRIVASGSFETLERTNSEFAELIRLGSLAHPQAPAT